MMLVTRFVAAIGLAAVAAAQGPALEARATTSLPSGCISLPGIGVRSFIPHALPTF